MDTRRGFEEALFPTLISTDFLQDLPKFCSGDAPKRVKTFERPFTRVPKIRFPLPHPPHGSPKSSTISPKNFRQLSTRVYRTCRQDTTLGANICKRVHSNTSLLGFTPASPEPSKICRAKQLQARMHVDANIHSWEYNKPACQTLIFLSVQISTQLCRRRNIKI